MYVIHARNVHRALPAALFNLDKYCVKSTSRNGDVLVSTAPVTTVYERPVERLTFWPERDINTAFLVYEALWMLSGRNDVDPLTRYIKTFDRYSDDGVFLHGAYGYRWRRAFGFDQLDQIVLALRNNKTDRRCVLQIWDAKLDLNANSKDIPCNDTVTFQINQSSGSLDMTVFCRSNDIIWGAYFANAFHFSVLHEYMARNIGVEVGTYHQISVNWHAYLETLKLVDGLLEHAYEPWYIVDRQVYDPYASGEVYAPPIRQTTMTIDQQVSYVLDYIEGVHLGYKPMDVGKMGLSPWMRAALAVLEAHRLAFAKEFDGAQAELALCNPKMDLIASMQVWLSRRVKRADQLQA